MDATFRTSRLLAATPREIFAAFEQAGLLAQWWGPEGFMSTFEVFEFEPGGRWIFTMHAPNGADFPNESVFREIEPDARIVIEHIVLPIFTLTILLTPRDGQTEIGWTQEFENAEFATKMRAMLETANQQVLDRLEAVLASSQGIRKS